MRESDASSLSQTVERAGRRQPGGIALLRKPLCENFAAEWPAVGLDEEREVASRGGVDDRAKVRMERER